MTLYIFLYKGWVVIFDYLAAKEGKDFGGIHRKYKATPWELTISGIVINIGEVPVKMQ